MPKISDKQRQARRDQILAATWKCFSRKGIHATSMEEILREAGLSAGAVYLYYKGKDELILAAISTYMTELHGLLLPVLTKEEPLAPLEFVYEVTSALTKHMRRRGIDLNVVTLMCWSEAQTNRKVRKLISGTQTRYREALAQVIRQWQQRKGSNFRGEPEDLAKVLLSIFLGFIVQSALLGGVDPGTISRGMEGFLGTATCKLP